MDNIREFHSILDEEDRNVVSNDIPIYQKKYINTENYVRGYETNPESNPIEIRDKLQWNNLISSRELKYLKAWISDYKYIVNIKS